MFNFSTKELVILAAAGATAISGSATAGYFFAKKRLTTQFDKVTQEEIAKAKEFYSAMYKKEEYESPADLAESLGLSDAVRALQSYSKESDREEPEAVEVTETVEVVTNVFTDAAPDDSDYFDYDEEVKKRSPDKPYILTVDEFMKNESDYNQVNLTYYEGDDVLADDKDKVVPKYDVDKLVGETNLEKFGVGSKDNKVVYIRNDRLSLEMEIVRSNGEYAQEVGGFIRHSYTSSKHRGKFRPDDDD